MASSPTSIRLTASEKRLIASAARQRGLSPTAYIKRAALEKTTRSDARLAKMEQTVAQMREMIEDELDSRLGTARWENHVKNNTGLYTGEEVRRELGLQD